MTRWSYTRDAGARGAGKGKQVDEAKSAQAQAPQHGIDVALAQRALGRLEAQMRALAAAEGRGSCWRTIVQLRNVARDICRDLARNPWNTMTAKQRAFCTQNAGKKGEGERVAREIVALHTSQAAEFKLDHPLKPPGRK